MDLLPALRQRLQRVLAWQKAKEVLAPSAGDGGGGHRHARFRQPLIVQGKTT
jgi:hypothetical protein